MVKILGSECTKCRMLENRVRELIMRTGLDIEVKKVTDIEVMIKYGIAMIPALVINEEVKSAGIIPKDEAILQWLKENLDEASCL